VSNVAINGDGLAPDTGGCPRLRRSFDVAHRAALPGITDLLEPARARRPHVFGRPEMRESSCTAELLEQPGRLGLSDCVRIVRLRSILLQALTSIRGDDLGRWPGIKQAQTLGLRATTAGVPNVFPALVITALGK
jgi:hypothetical protein